MVLVTKLPNLDDEVVKHLQKTVHLNQQELEVRLNIENRIVLYSATNPPPDDFIQLVTGS